ncbi:MAG TPA: BRCT domain-containing protein [Planctomycetota bacterium]|jgi:hypothetical protein|nr:BRCT domain-containing protein [Planctomycetota bacterium]
MAEFVTKKENGRRLAIIILCVIADAVALAVGIWALKKTNDVEKKPENPFSIAAMTKKVLEQRQINRALEDQLLAYGTRIGWKVDPTGSADRFQSVPLQAEALKSFLSDAVKPRKEREAAGEKSLFQHLGITSKPYKRWDDPGGGENLTLTAYFEEVLAKEKEFQNRIAELENQIKAELEREKQIRRETEEANKAEQSKLDGGAAANQPAAGNIGDYIRIIKDLNQAERTHAEELAVLDREAREAQNKATEVKNDFLRKRAAHEAVKADLTRRIDTILHRRAEAAELREEDGVILAINEARQICYINLLRKDRLFKGTKFTVFSLEKGGQKLDKGTIEVIDVREDVSSVCAILRVNNPDWPLKAGDKIYNELYEGGRPRHIAFAGRFTGKLSNDEAAALIRKFGDFYQEKVDEKTNYVVVAEGYEDHPNYKAAVEYGIKILREKILYDYLGVK